MTYAHGLGKGGGGGHGGGGHGGGGHGGGGHGGGGHGGGGHGGGGHHGRFHHGGRGRGWGGRGWYGGGGYSPGYVDYVSYSPCDECWSQPPSFVLPCLRYRGCVAGDPGVLLGLGQSYSSDEVRAMMLLAAHPATPSATLSPEAAANRARILAELNAPATPSSSTRNIAIGVVSVAAIGAGITWWFKRRRSAR
jgi:hypothetical protein